MYKLIDTIDNVLTIALCGNKVILKQGVDYKNNELKLYSIIQGQMKEEALISKDVINFRIQEEKAIGLTLGSNLEYYTYNILTNKIQKVDYFYYYPDNNSDIIIGIKGREKREILGIDSKLESVIWRSEDFSINFGQGENNFIYAANASTILKSINKKTGQYLWTCSISEIKEQLNLYSERKIRFSRVIGAWKDYIIMCLSDSSAILLIENKTGVANYHWKKDTYENGSLFSKSCNYLIPEEDKLIGLIDSLYWEIDLNTKEVSVHNLEEMFKAQNLRAIHLGRAVVRGTDLIFPSYRSTVDEKGKKVYNNSIAILDRTSLIIKWKYRFEDADYDGFFGQVEVDKNRIYVRTNPNKLYIFEKE